MPGRYPSSEFCLNHPDRPSMPHRRLCEECEHKAQCKTWHKNKAKYKKKRQKKFINQYYAIGA